MLEYLWMGAVYAAPSLLGIWLFSQKHFFSIFLVLAMEGLLMYLHKWRKDSRKKRFSTLTGVAFAMAGTMLNTILFPTVSHPDGLGAAVSFIMVLVHGLLYLILDTWIEP